MVSAIPLRPNADLRSECILQSNFGSITHRVNYSVPQDTALGPAEFITNTESVTLVSGRQSFDHRLFADDKHAYASTTLEGVYVRSRLHDRIAYIGNWCASRRPQREQDRACLIWKALLSETTCQHRTDGDCRRHPTSDSGSRSQRSTRPRFQHDATHRESDVVRLARRSAGPFVCSVEA